MAAATSRSNDTDAMRWPTSLYALIALGERQDDRPALCLLHQPQHVYCADPRTGERWCQDLARPKEPWRPHRMAAGTPEPVPAAVQLDEDRLGRVIAAGVVDGFRRARAEQKAESQT